MRCEWLAGNQSVILATMFCKIVQCGLTMEVCPDMGRHLSDTEEMVYRDHALHCTIQLDVRLWAYGDDGYAVCTR